MTKKIPLLRGGFAIVDDEDFDSLSKFTWHLATNGYAAKDGGMVLMHRLIMGVGKGQRIDHANRDKLDNRRCNLRIATASQNNANSRKRTNATSKYKGVSFENYTGRWKVQIKRDGKTKNLGRYDTEREAALVYDKAAKEVWGQFARINFEE